MTLPRHESQRSPAPLPIVDLLVLILDPIGRVELLYRLLKVVLQRRKEVSVFCPEEKPCPLLSRNQFSANSRAHPCQMKTDRQASKLSGFWFQRAVRPALPRFTLFSASSFKTTSPNFLFLLLLLPPSPILAKLLPPLSSIFLERLGHPSFFHLNRIYL